MYAVALTRLHDCTISFSLWLCARILIGIIIIYCAVQVVFWLDEKKRNSDTIETLLRFIIFFVVAFRRLTGDNITGTERENFRTHTHSGAN